MTTPTPTGRRGLSLAWRIRLALVALVALTCAVLTGVATTTLQQSNEGRLRSMVTSDLLADTDAVGKTAMAHPEIRDTVALVVAVEWPNTTVSTHRLLLWVDRNTEDFGTAVEYAVVNEGGFTAKAARCAGPGVFEQFTTTTYSAGSSTHWTIACDDQVLGFSYYSTGEQAGGWLLVHGLDRALAGDPVPDLARTLLLASAVALVATLLVAGWLTELISRPLARARKMADEVASGDLGVRLPVEGADEVAGMSAAVNTMADRLTAQIDDLARANQVQRRFVADVAHELRTPTAALLASAESLAHPETRDEASGLVIPQLRRLAGLTEDLLEISRMDAGRAAVVPSQVDLVDLVREVVDETGRPVDVALSAPAELPVELDPARTRVVVRNLVANALQHGAPPVTVRVGEAVGEAVVSVTDAGPGVPPDLRERVFDRFTRGDEARHGASTGLGLAIARENARLLGGALDLGADGTTFTLRLPATRGHAT